MLALVAFGGYAAFRLLEADITAEVYRERLAELSADHTALLERYNRVVRRTAVTELLVEDNRLRVVIRTAEGELQTLDAPYDPRREVYVDYVVRNGRIWIRRLFDEDTAPGKGMVIDPQLADVDWDADVESHGKAAYRSLGPGRWVVDVSGDGSLGLALRAPDETIELEAAPEIRQYEPVEVAVSEALAEIRLVEGARAVLHKLEAAGRSLAR